MFDNDISTSYTPTDVEPYWYQRWVESGCFHADETSSAPAYSIVIPPPNVTGVLTLGHVLNNTIQDILARRARQTGHEVLWLPGTDHAGIATQTVVERQLRKEEKKTRHDLGRAAFLERVWEWKKKQGGIILEQLKRLGCSCDWERERFTMDEAYSKKVQETFVDLYHKGLIYRGKRMVNWCPISLTALSDEEVFPKKQKGFLYYFKLEIVEEPGTWLEVATTRPETIMGDAALAVNPKDPRYACFIGKHVLRPLPVESKVLLPIVGDELVDMQFGTGVLKVTPAHDQLDYEIGVRHQLPIIDVMNPDGTLNSLAGPSFAGMDRFEARVKAAAALRELGLLVKEEVHENNVGFSERADVPIEPRLSEQWFLRYPKTVEARAAVREKLIRFFPERWEKVYDHWLENIQDWCISRQLWWGHQIPVWHAPASQAIQEVVSCQLSVVRNAEEQHQVTHEVSDETSTGVTQHLAAEVEFQKSFKVQLESPGPGWTQDPDVLDTWFSSWLWAHEAMDEETRKKFYPTSVLVTGPDIIFFWVARMIMAGLEYTEKLPFRDVYFTGIIRDKTGRKMSKSLGNSPDPLDLIAKYGADGLRFGIMRMAPNGQDIRFDEKQIEEGRNFANKLWNAARFRQMHGVTNANPDLSHHKLPDIAITLLAQFDTLHANLQEAYQEYRFQEMTLLLYHFFWNDYCDWFVEAAKPTLAASQQLKLQVEAEKSALLATMDHVFSGFLRLLHPFMPHITEELWKRLEFDAPSAQHGRPQLLLYTQPPAKYSLSHLSKEKIAHATKRTEALYATIRAARNLRGALKINAKQAIDFLITPQWEEAPWGQEELRIFSALVRAKEVKILVEPPPKESTSVLTEVGTITIPLEGLIDVEAERKRLNDEIKNVESELVKVRAKLANPAFVEKVPAAVLVEHQEREERWKERLASLQEMLIKKHSINPCYTKK
ncbi:MAG: valine--tRNA ligase [Chthoniobacterales bacterium]